jgi:serine phosphatase RsbU (regulator of sigma subunit)
LLIVAGDVAGKGLQAGMLVALLLGAIRTALETSDELEVVLGALDRRLMGRGNAQATCPAMGIAADGAASLANAGHMPPYLNGVPVPREGALPMGMMEDAEFSIMPFRLKDGDKLMLLSDGMAEATDANGHLFAFERVRELLHTARNLSEVAMAAQSFGQAENISVISVRRSAGLNPVAAYMPPERQGRTGSQQKGLDASPPQSLYRKCCS